MTGYLVQDWMKPDPITVTGNVTIPDAYWLMVNHRIRRLLVVDNEKLVGIVTMEDLRQKIPFTAFSMDAVRASDILAHYPVYKVMSHNPRTISPDIPLIEAARLMLENHISTLPVMKAEQLVGIITESDIFRAFVELIGKK
jgi:acetoin utilization protein AcuB